MNQTTSVRFHKGFVSDKLRYPVLAISKINPAEKEAIRAVIKPIVSGPEAEQFIFRTDPGQQKQMHQLGWSYSWLDHNNNVGVLKYKGIEVAVFYKRQIILEEPQPGEPIPEGWLKEPVDAWQRLDVLAHSARQANLFLRKQHQELLDKIKVLEQQVTAKQVIADDAVSAQYQLQVSLDKLTKYKDTLVERLQVISANVSGNKIRQWMDAHQKKKEAEAKRKARAAARLKKVLKEAHRVKKKTKGKKRKKRTK